MDNQPHEQNQQPPVTTPATSAPATPADTNTIMGILAYLGPLVIVPFIVAKDQPFVKFHVKQGAVLFAGELILYVVGSFFMLNYMLGPVMTIINLGFLIFSILGIVNVVQKKEAELPFIGHLAKHVNI